nr:MAG TPA: hypothetical protein [Caudoviricetes sp.]
MVRLQSFPLRDQGFGGRKDALARVVPVGYFRYEYARNAELARQLRAVSSLKFRLYKFKSCLFLCFHVIFIYLYIVNFTQI